MSSTDPDALAPSAALSAYDLTGRVAVVTGAASGIGQACAALLCAAGAAVVCADLDEQGACATAASLTQAGGRALGRRVDVSVPDEVDAVVSSTESELGRLDIMANVAGIIVTSPVMDTDDHELARVLAVNLMGVFYGCRAAARVMVAQRAGSIVNMASAAVDVPAAGLAAYGMAKAGVVQLTRVLAAEVGPSSVRVNAVAPGFVETAMTARRYTRDAVVDEERRRAVLDGVARTTPLRAVGRPEDVAHAVLYLASDASRYVTGQILRPNGGVAMPW